MFVSSSNALRQCFSNFRITRIFLFHIKNVSLRLNHENDHFLLNIKLRCWTCSIEPPPLCSLSPTHFSQESRLVRLIFIICLREWGKPYYRAGDGGRGTSTLKQRLGIPGELTGSRKSMTSWAGGHVKGSMAIIWKIIAVATPSLWHHCHVRSSGKEAHGCYCLIKSKKSLKADTIIIPITWDEETETRKGYLTSLKSQSGGAGSQT